MYQYHMKMNIIYEKLKKYYNKILTNTTVTKLTNITVSIDSFIFLVDSMRAARVYGLACNYHPF